MDSVTHILLGGTIAQLVAGRRAGFLRTFLLGGVAATLPDLDVFLNTGNVVRDHALHRHFMHALVMIPVLAAIAWGLILLNRRARPFAVPLYLAALLACLSHTVLDSLTSYGTVMFWPLSERRLAFDVIAVIDPLYTLPLIAGVIVAFWKRSLRAVAAGLVLSSAYMGLAVVQHGRAATLQRDLLAARGVTDPVNPRVLPQLGAIVVYRSVYIHERRIYADALRPTLFGKGYVKPGGSVPALDAADLRPFPPPPGVTQDFDRFAWFADGYVARSPSNPQLISDLRYTITPNGLDSIWGVQLEDTPQPRWIMTTRVGGGYARRLLSDIFTPNGYVTVAAIRPAAAP
jgi:inner membrane protein